MNWIKLGARTINLDLVVAIHEEDGGSRIEVFCVGDEDEPSYEFFGDEAVALRTYMAATGWVKVLPEPPFNPL